MRTAKEARELVADKEAFIGVMKQKVARAISKACHEARLETTVNLIGGRHVIRVVEWLEEEPMNYKVARSYDAYGSTLHISWDCI